MLIPDFTKLKRLISPDKIFNLYYFKPIDNFSIDSRTIKKGQGYAFIALKGKHVDGHDFIKQAIDNGASLVIAEQMPSFKCKVPVFIVSNTYDALKKLCRYIRNKKDPFVYAISGSIGKTTTKEMLAFLLEEKFNVLCNFKTENNILGVSKTIFSLKDQDVLILELGTNHPGEIAELTEIVYPDVGVLTFIKPVHLEGLKSLDGVFEEKISLLAANPAITAVLNKDDKYLNKVNFCKKIHWFGKSNDSNLYARLLESTIQKSTFMVQDKFRLDIASGFDGFIYNALAALLSASIMKIPIEELVARLNNFRNFPSQRMQIKEIGDLIFFNDAYNSNPYALCEALRMTRKFSSEKIAVIADMLELGEKSIHYHQEMAAPLIKEKFDYILTFGQYSSYLNESLKESGYKSAYHFSSHEDIVDFIRKKAKAGSLVFLKGSRSMHLEKIIESFTSFSG